MNEAPESPRLVEEHRAMLLRIAREAIAAHLERRSSAAEEVPEALRRPAGAFVTITVDGELRGCIGTLDAAQPLYRAVAESAVHAATRDPRFPPLSTRELARVRLEISVLGEFVPADPSRIVIGRHGLLIRSSGGSGLLLPQVPVEYGWDVPTFLERLCVKAGLPSGSWRRAGCSLESFTAEVFGEG